MTISFNNTVEDFVGYYMYAASKSGVILKKRRIARYLFSVLYFIIGLYFFVCDSIILGGTFVTLGIAWFLLFPLMTKNSSAKSYRKYIIENYQNKINRPVELSLGSEYVLVSDGINESKIAVSEFEKLTETKSVFYLKLKTAAVFIIPKNQIDTVTFKAEIAKLGTHIIEEPTWIWK